MLFIPFKTGNMSTSKKIARALVSVYYKEGLDKIIHVLDQHNVQLYSTGGTYDFIQSLGVSCNLIEHLTGYPSILDGRVKTLHPGVFGGILGRPDLESDISDMQKFHIAPFDLVIVNLYPFEQTVQSAKSHEDIIEKIDIGGVSLIRAAAKNYRHVLCVSDSSQYDDIEQILKNQQCSTSMSQRLLYAGKAFEKSSSYDSAIFHYLQKHHNTEVMDAGTVTASSDAEKIETSNDTVTNDTVTNIVTNDTVTNDRITNDTVTNNSATEGITKFVKEIQTNTAYPVGLRYGENPHQKGTFYGKLGEVFHKHHGKELSYNNLLDLDSAIHLIKDFSEPTFAILKHNNACGIASRENIADAWQAALQADPVSAYGGVLIVNRPVDEKSAIEINKIFFEIILAPAYEKNGLEILKSKKNRIILQSKTFDFQEQQFRSLLNGILLQDKDLKTETMQELMVITNKQPTERQTNDLLFANKVVKHSKSNAIVLASNKQMLASGIGQTSRVDALRQAIEKAKSFGFVLKGAVMASDAFFPFSDSVQIAHEAGIVSVIQPGGSVRDNETIEYCNAHEISMVFTGIRHFKH